MSDVCFQEKRITNAAPQTTQHEVSSFEIRNVVGVVSWCSWEYSFSGIANRKRGCQFTHSRFFGYGDMIAYMYFVAAEISGARSILGCGSTRTTLRYECFFHECPLFAGEKSVRRRNADGGEQTYLNEDYFIFGKLSNSKCLLTSNCDLNEHLEN